LQVIFHDLFTISIISETNDSAGKLQNHLKLLKNEYSKLQKSYADLQRKFDDLQAKSSDPAADNSSFNSRLVMIVASLYGRKTYSDLTIKLKDKQMPAHKFVLQAR
jgi:rabankyrin-5